LKISLNWLNEFVQIDDFFSRPAELATLLTKSGFEVEAVENPGEQFRNVVVGQVKVLGRHPNADRLTLCQVDIGPDENGVSQISQIVCGAQNHRQGDKVVVALPGAVLPGDFAIKISKIRDVESRGMLCSEKELALSKESEGIMILPADAPVGKSFFEYQGLNDVLFEVNVTPNRADVLSHLGLAREVACLLGRKLKKEKAVKYSPGVSVKKIMKVQVSAPDLCLRYAGRVVKGLRVAKSPSWLKARLEALGLNSINAVVDVTNYVMLERGQPLHAFDLRHLKGAKGQGEIDVARASHGEEFQSLDGTVLRLTSDDLTIRDSERAVALAGVVGGQNSGVMNDTVDVFVESACFLPASVRRTSRRLGVETDAAYRFSRGTDPDGVLAALDRACELLVELCGGQTSADLIDVYPKKPKPRLIKVRKTYLEDRLGYPVKLSDFTAWMRRLHCEVRPAQNNCVVEVPSFRWDLESEVDLVEEYGRLNGYDSIPESFPALLTEPTDDAPDYTQRVRVSGLAMRAGFLEAINYNFTSPEWQNKLFARGDWSVLGLSPLGSDIRLQNPLSEETAVMRKSLVPGLLKNMIGAYHKSQNHGRLFEVGRAFGSATIADAANAHVQGGSSDSSPYREADRLAFLEWGESANLWAASSAPTVTRLKGRIESLLLALRPSGARTQSASVFQWRALVGGECPAFLNSGQTVTLFYQGRNIGFISSVHPRWLEELKIRVSVAVAEFNLALLMAGQPKKTKAQPLSAFQSVERDLALIVPLDRPAAEVYREIVKLSGPELVDLTVFDQFQGQGVPDGSRSLAFKLVLQKHDGTFSDAEVQTAVQKVVAGLEKKFQIRPRA
jgi:phenylalanyl-tRNA synthetase beta chain